MNDEKYTFWSDEIWYMKEPYWFWRLAGNIACFIFGHNWGKYPDDWFHLPNLDGSEYEYAHGDCNRCGA